MKRISLIFIAVYSHYLFSSQASSADHKKPASAHELTLQEAQTTLHSSLYEPAYSYSPCEYQLVLTLLRNTDQTFQAKLSGSSKPCKDHFETFAIIECGENDLAIIKNIGKNGVSYGKRVSLSQATRNCFNQFKLIAQKHALKTHRAKTMHRYTIVNNQMIELE